MATMKIATCSNCGKPCSIAKTLFEKGIKPLCRDCGGHKRDPGRIKAYSGPSDSAQRHAELLLTNGIPGVTTEEIEELSKHAQTTRDKMRPRTIRAEVKIKTSVPIMVIFSADWHFGAQDCNVDFLNAHLKFMLDTPNVFVILCGDEIDNFINFFNQEPIFKQSVSPEMQIDWMIQTIEKLATKKKILAKFSDNHIDKRFNKALGFNPIEFITRRFRQFAYFDGMGLLELYVNKVRYKIIGAHMWKGHSMYNMLHSQGRGVREHCPDADVCVGAHRHEPAYTSQPKIGSFIEPMEWTHLIACGSFKGADTYSLEGCYRPGNIGTPAMVFHHDRREAVYFASPEQASVYMRGLEI